MRASDRRSGGRAAVLGAVVLLVTTIGCSSSAPASSDSGNGANDSAAATARRDEPSVDPALEAKLKKLAQDAMGTYDLRALIVRVTKDGKNVYTGALGTSMTGVPATPDMHVRNGAFAFTYIGEIVSQLVDQKKLSLDDKLSKWLPDLPNADKVTIKELLNHTSGYADYVYTNAVIGGVEADPFRQWTGDELIKIGTGQPIQFEPGTNWGYSHTNYVILGKVLERLLGRPMPEIMDTYVIKPMGLTNTSSNANTPAVPEPALHTFSSERRETLKVPAGVPFTEETTYWNPSWTTAQGAVQTSDVYDITTSMEVVGNGKLVSKASYKAQTDPLLAGFGSKDPTGKCPACQPLTTEKSYGLGVLLVGPWIAQIKNYAGSGITGGYLPSGKYAVTVITTYEPAAFDDTGAAQNTSSTIFSELATAVAPKEATPGL